ncbi:hypothetical protein VQ042_22640 [Aurantimonas sp. A2-1-M11]|uniref:hypothetical protein n=1 Tax=Aurantimonas sp. A2-1-M11 TaxID=3113712 RepID=UPI002F93DD7D
MQTAATSIHFAHSHAQGKTSRGPFWPHILMALFGAGWAVSFDVGVRLYGGEIVALVCLPILPWKSAYRRHRMVRSIFGAYSLWVAAIILADLWNGTGLFDSARNMATPILGGISLLFVVSVTAQNPKALLSFLAATALAKGILGEPLYGDRFSEVALELASLTADTNFFKVRVDPFLTPAILLIACWLGRKNLLTAAVVLVSASLGYFVFDARSSGLVFFLSAMTLVAIYFRFRPRMGQILIAGVAATALSYSAYVAYVDYTFANNPLGHNGQQLTRMEDPYNPFELIIEGRSEWLVIPSAIAERPIFGWGSWAIDKDYRFTYMREVITGSYNFESVERESYLGFIPVHSLLGSTWVWSGLLGFAAMLRLLISASTMASRLPRSPERILLPAVTFFTLLMFWHFFFSPPQAVRLFFPVALGCLIVSTREEFGKRRRLVQHPYWVTGGR